MSKQALKDFKKVWLNTYIKQYKEGNIYNNINLTETEKDSLWELIVFRGGIL